MTRMTRPILMAGLALALALALAACGSEEPAGPASSAEMPEATETRPARNVVRQGITQYESGRLNLRVEYPSDLMRPAARRSGATTRTFIAPDSALVLTVGLDTETPARQVLERAREGGVVLRDETTDRTSDLLVQRGPVLHRHKIVDHGDSLFVLEMQFPEAQRAALEETVETVAASFPGEGR